jgi:hypothetical protein
MKKLFVIAVTILMICGCTKIYYRLFHRYNLEKSHQLRRVLGLRCEICGGRH